MQIQLTKYVLRPKFGSKTFAQRNHFTDLSLYLDRTLAQRKAKSKVKVTHCRSFWKRYLYWFDDPTHSVRALKDGG